MSKIFFTKVRAVKSPQQSYTYPAGTDIFIPEYNTSFRDDLIAKNHNTGDYELSISPSLDNMTITIAPHGRINIPSGIKVDLENKDSCLLVANKSGVASKKGLNHLAELIDADYHGEIHINLYNTGADPVTVTTGDKITQLMNLPIIYPTWEETSSSEFLTHTDNTLRGEKGFGSSGDS